MANQNDAAESAAPASVAPKKSRKRNPVQAERERIADRKRYEEGKNDPSIAERRNAIRRARHDRDPEKVRAAGRKWTQSRKDDPDFREARRKTAREWAARHPDKVAQKAAKSRATPLTPEQLERRREGDRRRYAEVKSDHEFKIKNRAKTASWNQRNPGKSAADKAAARAATLEATREKDRAKYHAKKEIVAIRIKTRRANRSREAQEADRLRSKAYYEANKERILSKNKDYAAQTKPERRSAYNRWRTTRRRNDPHYKLLCTLGTRLRRAIRAAGAKKLVRTSVFLGCSIEHLAAHFEGQFRDGMTWKNHGSVWHVDHIKPCCLFDLTIAAQQAACFHWTNLQPLLAEENIRKNRFYQEVA